MRSIPCAHAPHYVQTPPHRTSVTAPSFYLPCAQRQVFFLSTPPVQDSFFGLICVEDIREEESTMSQPPPPYNPNAPPAYNPDAPPAYNPSALPASAPPPAYAANAIPVAEAVPMYQQPQPPYPTRPQKADECCPGRALGLACSVLDFSFPAFSAHGGTGEGPALRMRLRRILPVPCAARSPSARAAVCLVRALTWCPAPGLHSHPHLVCLPPLRLYSQTAPYPESSNVGKYPPRTRWALSAIARRWRERRGAQLCGPARPCPPPHTPGGRAVPAEPRGFGPRGAWTVLAPWITSLLHHPSDLLCDRRRPRALARGYLKA